MKTFDKNTKVQILILLAVFLGLLVFPTQASENENVSGFAWSDNIGWISFNNISDGSSVNYGVNVNNNNGELSGYAWSDNIGWISFNESDLSGCPSGPCRAEIKPAGQLGRSNVKIVGWARACAGTTNGDCTGGTRTDGWDGWIKFDHGKDNEPYIDVNGDWHGWAWGSDVVGWISFNGSDPNAGGNYKVTLGGVNPPPTATNLHVVKGDYCSIPPTHYFSWTYSDPDGDNESKFQFQVDDNVSNNGDFPSPEIDRTVTGSWANGASNNQSVIVVESPTTDRIVYGKAYYWRVKVYDERGGESGWIQYNDPADTDGDGNPLTFTTEKHRYPSVDFDWSPSKPSVGEDVLFTDQSVTYGGATELSWSWIFEDGNPAASNEQNPTVQFTKSGKHQVSLKVTDSDNYTCPATKSVGAQVKLPGWREILPW